MEVISEIPWRKTCKSLSCNSFYSQQACIWFSIDGDAFVLISQRVQTGSTALECKTLIQCSPNALPPVLVERGLWKSLKALLWLLFIDIHDLFWHSMLVTRSLRRDIIAVTVEVESCCNPKREGPSGFLIFRDKRYQFLIFHIRSLIFGSKMKMLLTPRKYWNTLKDQDMQVVVVSNMKLRRHCTWHPWPCKWRSFSSFVPATQSTSPEIKSQLFRSAEQWNNRNRMDCWQTSLQPGPVNYSACGCVQICWKRANLRHPVHGFRFLSFFVTTQSFICPRFSAIDLQSQCIGFNLPGLYLE